MEFLLVVGFSLLVLFLFYKGVEGLSKPRPPAAAPLAAGPRPSAPRSGREQTAENLVQLPVPRPSPPEPSIYLSSDRWDELLVRDPSGLPTLYFQMHNGRLWLTEPSTGLLVSVGNKHLRRMGIWSVNVRGLEYHKAAVRAGDFRPGSKVRLVREPDNAYDKNAVAVCAAPVGILIGYFNKGMAPGLAKLLDSGATVDAISVAGDGVGKTGSVAVVAASPAVLQHLLRENPLATSH